MTHIIISGLGAIGGYYGGMLARLGEELSSLSVSFYMREGAHLDRIRTEGIHIASPELDFVAHPHIATAKATELPPADFLFLATKSYHLIENLEQLAPCITDGTVLIPTQNGLDHLALIADRYPRNTILPAACHITSRRTSPGEIYVRSDDNLLRFGTDSESVGRISAQETALAERLFCILRAADIKCKLSMPMGSYLRRKFIMLSPAAVATSYFDCNMGEVFRLHVKILQELVNELAALYRVAGLEQDIFLETKAMEAMAKMPQEATTSMHSDIAAGHRSELESLVGYIVREGERLHVDTPRYKELYRHLKERENL